MAFCTLYRTFFLSGSGGTPSGSRALATSLCGRRLGCGTSPRVKWGGCTVWGMTSQVRGDTSSVRHSPATFSRWRRLFVGVTSRGRGNSLRLAETRLVLDINLVIFFEKCAKNRKKCEILARRGTSWHVFSGEGAPSPVFLVCDCDCYNLFIQRTVVVILDCEIKRSGLGNLLITPNPRGIYVHGITHSTITINNL